VTAAHPTVRSPAVTAAAAAGTAEDDLHQPAPHLLPQASCLVCPPYLLLLLLLLLLGACRQVCPVPSDACQGWCPET
jgi:hypothetical protein